MRPYSARAFSLLLLSAASVARAHDFWIEPTSARPVVGERVGAALRVGEKLEGEVVPRRPNRIVRFEAVDDQGTVQPLRGAAGADPAGAFVPARPGLHRVLYQGNPARLDLEPEKFTAYLREEGLEKIVARRAELGESELGSREAYSRSALAAVCVVASEATAKPNVGAPRALGLTLELLPESDPCSWLAGDEVALRLLFRGRPLEGARVEALHAERLDDRPAARTDAEGRIRLRLDRSGRWLVKAVEMERAEGIPEVEWESYWASLTVELRPAT
jgi:uncharacterized GH25 family protein